MVHWFTGKFELGNNLNHKKITKKNLRTNEPNYENRTYVNQKVIFLMKKIQISLQNIDSPKLK
jgi:hypothetical protein